MDAVGIGFLDGYYHQRVGNRNHSLANTGLTGYASKNGSRYIDIAQNQATLDCAITFHAEGASNKVYVVTFIGWE